MKGKGIKQLMLILMFSHRLFSQVSFTISPYACDNNIVALVAANGTTSVNSYSWTSVPSGVIFSSPTAPTTNISFLTAGNFTIALNYTLTNSSGSFTNMITVLPSPVIVSMQSATSTCIENNSPVNSKPVVISLSGASSYSWQPSFPPPVVPNNGSSATVRPLVSTCYTITGYSSSCSNTISTCIGVRPRITIHSLANDTLICLSQSGGELVTIEAVGISTAAIGLPASYSYSWSSPIPGGILTPLFQYSVIVSPTSTTSYTLVMKDSLGCVSLPEVKTISVMFCLGLKEIGDDFGVVAYPNPFQDKVKLLINSEIIQSAEIRIYNAVGQCFTVLKPGSGSQMLDFSFLPKGVYYLEVSKGPYNRVVKLCKH